MGASPGWVPLAGSPVPFRRWEKNSSKMGGRGWWCVSAAACAARIAPGADGVRGPARDPREVPHIESLCAPKRREKFLGMSPVVELEVHVVGASQNDSSQVAS